MAEPHYITSEITGRTYDVFSIIRILNIKQAIYYIDNGIALQDIEISNDRKTGERVLVFCFNRKDTRVVFDKWCRRQQEKQ